MSKIKVNEIEAQSGSTITIPTGQSLVVTDGLATSSLPTVPVTKGGTGLTSLGTANQVVAVNSGATALEFQDASGGKTLGVTELVNSTRQAVSNVASTTLWTTSYTQIKANSKLKIDVLLHGKNGGGGAMNWKFVYDGTNYNGYIGYVYTPTHENFSAGSFMIDGSATTGSKTIQVISDTQDGQADRAFEVFNPNTSDDTRLHQTRSSIIITELDL
jgi:hypothetical protein